MDNCSPAYAEKRAFKRKSVEVNISFVYQNTIYTGTVTNASKKGMYVETEISIPAQTWPGVVEIRLPLKGEIMEVPVRVRRLSRRNGYCTGMGVELINPASILF